MGTDTMKRGYYFNACLILAVASNVSAGALSEGNWSPSDCGEKPEIPSLDSTSIDALNESLGAINSWERKSKKYFECLVKEANADNTVIAKTANDEQAKFRESIDNINKEAAELKIRLENE